MQVMLDLSVAGSSAHTYARFQIASAQAEADRGSSPEPPTLEYAGDAIRICPKARAGFGSAPCNTFADFTTAPGSDLLTGFTVDGSTIDGRVVDGGATASSGDARFTLEVGLEQDDVLVLMVKVVSGPETIVVAPDLATYLGAASRLQPAAGLVGPPEVPPNASQLYVVVFTNAAPGGRLILGGLEGASEYEVTLAVA